jgi:hypothetical protein
LTVDRIDFLRQTVRIDRQLISPSGKGPVVFGPPKTPSSNRVMTLPDSVRDVLAAHLARFGSGSDGLVFSSNTGASLRRSVWGKAYKSAAKSVGVDSSTHDLRHHCARVLISSGVSIKAVQQYLGHKNASETLDTYGHLMPGDNDRVRAAIDASLSGNVHGMCTRGQQQSPSRTFALVSGGGSGEAAYKRDSVTRKRAGDHPSSATYPRGAAASPEIRNDGNKRAVHPLCSVLLRMGFTKPATSP